MTTTTTPTPWHPTIPGFLLFWDSTSLGLFKDCPRKFHYSMIHQWSLKSKSHHLTFGGLYASGVERYAHLRAKGLPHDAAVLGVVRWVLEASGKWTFTNKEGVVVELIPTTINGKRSWRAVGAAGDFKSVDESELTWTPWNSGDSVKNRYTLVRTLVWNFEDRLGSPFHPVTLANGRPAVELSFNFPAFELDGETISLAGHMDQIVELEDKLYVLDDKTTGSALTASYFHRYTPDNQMSLYSIAGKVILGKPIAGVLVRAAQIGVNFARFATAQVTRPPAILTEWMADFQAWVRLAKTYALANHWPGNDKHCVMCDFRRVCAVSPSHREAWLREDFEKREWNPLKIRGDI